MYAIQNICCYLVARNVCITINLYRNLVYIYFAKCFNIYMHMNVCVEVL